MTCQKLKSRSFCRNSISNQSCKNNVIMSPPFRVGRHIAIAWLVCLSITKNRFRSVTWKPFKVSSWNFIQILTNIRQHAEHKNHNSCIYTFWVMPLWTLSITKSFPLYNLKTVQGFFMELHTNTNVLFLTSDNEFSGIIYSLFRGRLNIFLTIFSTKFVVKCATKILKIGWQKQVMSKNIFEQEFSIEK